MMVSEGYAAARAILPWVACATYDHVWVRGPAAAGVCVYPHGLCYHRGL